MAREARSIIFWMAPEHRVKHLLGIAAAHPDGATFQTKPVGQFDVMLLSPKTGGVGLTITAANHVIHLSHWWNPAVEDQCTDRVFRIGQKKPVKIYYPMAIHPAYGERSFVSTENRKTGLNEDIYDRLDAVERARKVFQVGNCAYGILRHTNNNQGLRLNRLSPCIHWGE